MDEMKLTLHYYRNIMMIKIVEQYYCEVYTAKIA